MLVQQVQFSQKYAQLFTPIEGELKASVGEHGVEGAINYENLLKSLVLELKPELDSIETRVIVPVKKGLETIRAIGKTAEKRNHKQLDHDRRQSALKKLQERGDKTFRDETALYKAENEAEQASQDFKYFNDLLKRELNILFDLEQKFIQPVFQIFYFIQLRIYYLMHTFVQKINTGAMDFRGDIESAFMLKRQNIRDCAERLAILHSRNPDVLTGQSKYQRAHELQGKKTATPSESVSIPDPKDYSKPGPWMGKDTVLSPTFDPPPPYLGTQKLAYPADGPSGVIQMPEVGPSRVPDLLSMSVDDEGLIPPAPPPRPSSKSEKSVPVKRVVAIFPFAAQREGDLSFKTGDIIDVVTEGEGSDDWWVGRLGGMEGQFPGKWISNGDEAVTVLTRDNRQLREIVYGIMEDSLAWSLVRSPIPQTFHDCNRFHMPSFGLVLSLVYIPFAHGNTGPKINFVYRHPVWKLQSRDDNFNKCIDNNPI